MIYWRTLKVIYLCVYTISRLSRPGKFTRLFIHKARVLCFCTFRTGGGRLSKYSEFLRPLSQRLLIDSSVFDGLFSIFHRTVVKSRENIAVVSYTTGTLTRIRSQPTTYRSHESCEIAHEKTHTQKCTVCCSNTSPFFRSGPPEIMKKILFYTF